MPPWSVWYVRASLGWLLVGTLIGASTLALPGVLPGRWLVAHIEILIVGWFAHLALGVAAWILPKLPPPRRFGSPNLAWTSFALLDGGTFAAIGTALLDGPASVLVAARLVQFSGCVVFAVYIRRRIRPFGG